MSLSLCQPRQMVIMPGSPSDFRSRKPPSLAIQCIASCTVGGFFEGVFFSLILHSSDCHSDSVRNEFELAFGLTRFTWVIHKILHAIMLAKVRYFFKRT